MALVEYGSDSDSEQQQEEPRRTLPRVDDHDKEDDQEEDHAEFDPSDAFGINKITTEATTTNSTTIPTVKSSAPDVISSDLHSTHSSLITRPSDNVIFYNASYSDLTRPLLGPSNPWGQGDSQKLVKQNALTGHVEEQHFSEFSFREQQRSFHVLGYAMNPSINAESNEIVGDLNKAGGLGGQSISQVKPTRKDTREIKRRRMGKGKVGVFEDPDEEQEEEEEQTEEGQGEGKGEGEGEPEESNQSGEGSIKRKKPKKEQKEYLGPWAGWEGDNTTVAIPTEEEYEEQELQGGPLLNKQERRRKLLEDANRKEVGFGEEKSVFHGKETRDYLGRSYLHVPLDVDGVNLRGQSGEQECFVPKKCVHTWSGHTKGVSRIQLFPGSGHLILSGSLDTRIKVRYHYSLLTSLGVIKY
jgi:pre-mRNA-processing factor 17